MEHDPLWIQKTLEARLAAVPALDDLAETVERAPRATLSPRQSASPGERAALAALSAIHGGLAERLSLHETLGEGGMGVVHLATQETLGRHVAVKTLRQKGEDDAVVRILREAWVTGALEHPNVVPVYDIGLDAEGAPIIVMKRIEGHHWGELMRDAATVKARFGADDLLEWNLRILVAVANAIHFAHARRVLHRDLKPENVMIGAFGEVYVLDWGLAVSLSDDPASRLPAAKTATEIAGTPSYMAPEMLLGQPGGLTERTDVYLLGALLYEIFAGVPPHTGDTMQALWASVLLSTPAFAPGFPKEAKRLCARAMARDPTARFASAEELKRAVEDYLRHRGSRRLAFEARRSLERMTELLRAEPAGEERSLAMFHLLGECRFGYRAALAAWPENQTARAGLDRALLLVVEEELTTGEPATAAALLREVQAAPEGLSARVEAAVAARQEAGARLQRLADDHDRSIGSRTRMFGGLLFGVLWTLTPFARLLGEPFRFSHRNIAASSAIFLVIGLAFQLWARESLTRTALNRKLSRTFAMQFAAQIVMALGCELAGVSDGVTNQMIVFSWMITEGLLAIHVERAFAVPAAACAVAFVTMGRFPETRMWLTSGVNFVLMVTLVRVWLPAGDVASLRERVHERRRAFLHRRPQPLADGEDD